MGHRLIFPREVLLVEVERRCRDAHCNARTRIGLTKAEARAYCSFKCARCEQTWDDSLSERDIPEWWEALVLTGLDGLRPLPCAAAEAVSGEVVERMSDAWRARLRGLQDEGREPDGED